MVVDWQACGVAHQCRPSTGHAEVADKPRAPPTSTKIFINKASHIFSIGPKDIGQTNLVEEGNVRTNHDR